MNLLFLGITTLTSDYLLSSVLFHSQAYVEGEQCSTCQRGYFHLSESIPQGCLSCFCMGVTNQCTSSDYYRDKVLYVLCCRCCVLFALTIQRSKFSLPSHRQHLSSDDIWKTRGKIIKLFYGVLHIASVQSYA